MAQSEWPTRRLSISGLQLDQQNARLSWGRSDRSQREIIQYLFEHEEALAVATSIARHGYFASEPLLATNENESYVVLEGNRRLAALKALRDPDVLDGTYNNRIMRVLREAGPGAIDSTVRVTIAPSRAMADRQIAVRHIGTPVRRWRPENQARFILAKLDEGYDEATLMASFGFTATAIRAARETWALADAVRSLELPPELRKRIDSPDPTVISTLRRVLDAPTGRAALGVERDAGNVFLVMTTREEFTRVFTRFVTDLLSDRQDSRSLNTHENIGHYFQGWEANAVSAGVIAPIPIAEIRSDRPPAPPTPPPPVRAQPRRTRRTNLGALPRNLQVRFGSERLVAIRSELVKLKRDEFPNAGAVLLRVFFELMVRDYLDRNGDMPKIRDRLKGRGKLPENGRVEMRHLKREIIRLGKEHLEREDADRIERALGNERWIEDLNAFVHGNRDLPTPLDIKAFWERTEPLFRLMLEEPVETSKNK